MQLGQMIVKMRKDYGLTQDDFAQKFNVTRQTVSNWVMILASPGQHSCNTRTHIPTTFGQAFLYYPDIHS